MEVLRPRTLAEALVLRAEHPGALAIRGGTDVMVELNFDRARPEAILDLGEVAELGGWSREDGTLRLGAGLTYAEIEHGELASELPALAEASRTVGSPQIRNRGTLGGNLGTASPAGDALPPLLVDEAEVELASAARGPRRMSVREFLRRAEAQRPRGGRADRRRCSSDPSGAAQTFMKVGPRNAMVIAVCSLAVAADRERGEIRASFGSAGPVPGFVRVPLDEARTLPGAVAAACSPIDDVRGTAAYRRHALGVLAGAPSRGASRHEDRGYVVNGERMEADVWPGESLLFTLRERMGLPGSKNACEQGECGSCSVLLDGKLVCSCLVLAAQADGHEIVTVEGLGEGDELHPVQAAFVEAGAVQCGFCTPGLVVAAADLIAARARPERRTTSARRCPATSAAAPAIRRSSTR